MNYYDKFSLNQVFRSKTLCGFAYRADFCRFLCVSHGYWWGGAVAIAAFPPPPAAVVPHSNFSLNNPSLTAVDRIAHRFVVIQPTCRETTDLKKPVGESVKLCVLL
jgi:hypothetical protein